MRNIRGSLNNFYEVFPDEGEVDFSKSYANLAGHAVLGLDLSGSHAQSPG